MALFNGAQSSLHFFFFLTFLHRRFEVKRQSTIDFMSTFEANPSKLMGETVG
eukprot:NODE_72_length_2708_cov_53.849944_g68_i0.p3 GENE.NODE_72_length_2708_cov_53.849944_g68_i0~~NODE_72_length_2708_cov_53.849944_g68_i0.p3  ORF type:complete len:52 (-),score=4.49 NODE_72_length_2708_cov_53.849944_g68_i0:2172-2327(-)